MHHELTFDKILYYPKKVGINKFSFINTYDDILMKNIDDGIIRFKKGNKLIGEGIVYLYNNNEYISVYNQYGTLQLINIKDKANIYSYEYVKNMVFLRDFLTKTEYEFVINHRLLTLIYKVFIYDEEYLTNRIFDIEPNHSLYLKKHVFTYKGLNIYEYDVYKIDDNYYIFLILRNDKKELSANPLDIVYICLRLTNYKEINRKPYMQYFTEYLGKNSVTEIYKTSNVKYVTNLAIDILTDNKEYEELIYLLKKEFKEIDLFFYK